MRKLNIDLDKYMVYEDPDGDLLAAIAIEHHILMDEYYRKYDRFKSAPNDVTIEGYRVVADDQPDEYKIDEIRMNEFQVNQLRAFWVERRVSR